MEHPKFKIKQKVSTPYGDAVVFASTERVVNVKYLNPQHDDPMFGKYYENPTFQIQKNTSELSLL